LTSRNLSNMNVSRPAAHLLNLLIESKILKSLDVPSLIDATLFSDGLNGPVGMSDAALILWSAVVDSHASGPLVAQQRVVRLVNWFSSYWILSTSSQTCHVWSLC
jgi:hypothetical protein